ncbi:MAG TPA: hypothetical protein VJ011_10930 [Steroidobacteraceae bacterium]|nr:hypothetical protein [Steroidobacteraceae bacterium]
MALAELMSGNFERAHANIGHAMKIAPEEAFVVRNQGVIERATSAKPRIARQ